MTAGVLPIELMIPIDYSGDLRLEGDASLRATIAILDPSDLSDVNVTREHVSAAGSFQGTVVLASLFNTVVPIQGVFETDDSPPEIEFVFTMPSTLEFRMRQTGTTQFTIGILPQFQGTLVASIDGSLDTSTGHLTGVAALEVVAGQIRETFSAPFDYLQPLDEILEFPQVELSSLADRVFADHNQNGMQDENEPGFGGIAVKLFAVGSGESTFVESVESDDDGYYSFYNLPAGEYAIQVDQLPEAFDLGRFQAGNNPLIDSDVRSRTGSSNVISLATAQHLRDLDIALRQVTFEWVNPNQIEDVNDDGEVTALDALLIINEMSRRGGDESLSADRALGEFYYDVTGDGEISALDALRVINAIGRERAVAIDSEWEGKPRTAGFPSNLSRSYPYTVSHSIRR